MEDEVFGGINEFRGKMGGFFGELMNLLINCVLG